MAEFSVPYEEGKEASSISQRWIAKAILEHASSDSRSCRITGPKLRKALKDMAQPSDFQGLKERNIMKSCSKLMTASRTMAPLEESQEGMRSWWTNYLVDT